MTERPWRAWEVTARRRERAVVLVPVRRSSTLSPPLPADLPVAEAPVRTGFAGRPTILREPIECELRRRAEQGEMITTSLKAEAEHLVEWCRVTHGSAPKPKTLQNSLRDLYRELKSRNSF